MLQTLTAGYDNVLPALPDGVTLCNARGVHEASTAEPAVTLLLASLRRFPTSSAQPRGASGCPARRRRSPTRPS